MEVFDLRSEIDIGYRSVTVNQRTDLQSFRTWRPDPNHALGSLVTLLLEKLLDGAEPIRLDNDVVI
jgi:hypothetical protein